MKKMIIVMLVAFVALLAVGAANQSIVAASLRPDITSFTPTHARTGTLVDITIRGINFISPDSRITKSCLYDRVDNYIIAKSTEVVNSTTVIAHAMNLSGLETTTRWAVCVWNEDNSEWYGSHVGNEFTVDSPINPTYPYSTYLAEGSTGSDPQTQFETWILVVNPTTSNAKINMVYNTDKGPVQGPQFTMTPNTRKSVNVGDTVKTWSVSTIVQSNQKVYCERSMYWNGRIGGNGCLGVNKIGQDWILPEGSTNGGFETWVLIQNPNDTAITAQLTFITDKGKVNGPKIKVTAQSRMTVNVADHVPNTWSVSTEVSADKNVAVGRSTYWNNRHAGTSCEGTLLE